MDPDVQDAQYEAQTNGQPQGSYAALPLSPSRTEQAMQAPRPMPPFQEQGPFTQADKIRMAKLQAGMSAAEQQYGSGMITQGLLQNYRNRIGQLLGPLQKKQQQDQQRQQKQQEQQAMQQAALQETIMGVHLQQRAKGFMGTVATHIDPDTGRATHMMPRMGAHGFSHYEKINEDNDSESGPGVEDFQTLLQRAQQQIPPPQGVGPPMMNFKGRPMPNPYWKQWHSQTNQLAQKWMGNQQREQQQASVGDQKVAAEERMEQRRIQSEERKHQWQLESEERMEKRRIEAEGRKQEFEKQKSHRDYQSSEYDSAYKLHQLEDYEEKDAQGNSHTKQRLRDPGVAHAMTQEYLRRKQAFLHPEKPADQSGIAGPPKPEDETGGEMGKAHADFAPPAPKPDPDKSAIDRGLGG